MSSVVITAALVANLALVDEGKATRYRPGLMQTVVANRLEWKQITPEQVKAAAGFVALQDRKYLGRWAWLRWPDGRLLGPYLVVDCGAQHDQDHLDKIHFAVDLSAELAVELGVINPVWGVRVYVQEGEQTPPGETYHLEETEGVNP